MRLFEKKIGLGVVLAVVLLSGCATPPIVPPTRAELDAAFRLKKTVALLDLTDTDSAVQGVGPTATFALQQLLGEHFNFVEQNKLKEAIAAAGKGARRDPDWLGQVGRLSGADYIVYGDAAASLDKPMLRYAPPSSDNYGEVWVETAGRAELVVYALDVRSGNTVFAGKGASVSTRKDEEVKLEDPKQMRGNEAQKFLRQASDAVTVLSQLNREHAYLLSNALGQAARDVYQQLRSAFPHSGEVLQLLPDNEVVINLGSAYGIRPRQQLTVWQKGTALHDPKTGMEIVPKEKIATLKVHRVTSGLTSVARGKPKEISRIHAGDEVFMQ